VLAPSFARIYFRNAINSGLPALECDTSAIRQDDDVEVDLARNVAIDHTRGIELPVTPLPEVMRAVLVAGGVKAYLAEHGDLVLPPIPTNAPGDVR
jgi:3-isopropylmalate/(R)-2-methylmalate dehydratase small subunit